MHAITKHGQVGSTEFVTCPSAHSSGYKLAKFKFKKGIGNSWFTNRIADERNKSSRHVGDADVIESFQ